MKKIRKMAAVFLLSIGLALASCQSVSALTESEAQERVEAVGKEAVSGNVLVWFLCAIAFLKVSQKIDSFMSSLGINVGHTGSSMIAEAIVAARGFGAVRGMAGKHFGAGGGGNPGKGGTYSAAGSAGGFLAGGLAGIVSRQARNGAASAVTTPSDTKKAGKAMSGAKKGSVGGLAGMAGRQIYASSVSKGGGFANDVISSVATGSIAGNGIITGEKAAEALQSYLGYAALGEGAEPVPSFTNVEIGGGRITGTEVSDGHPEGISFGMYCTSQYAVPEGSYDTVHTADGTAWYRQYAADAVDRTPYMAADGSIAYKESIVKKMPPAPRRKDRL